MSGIGLVFNIAKDALLTQQYAMDVTSHNIANVDTEGYSRQTAVINAKQPAPFAGFMFGQGVALNSIVRNTNDFLEKSLQDGQSDLSSVNEQSTYMSVLESMFDESSGQGLSSQLDDFWSSLNDLANNPSGSAERGSLVGKSTSLADSLNNLNISLNKTSNEINSSVQSGVDDINQILPQIAELNKQIVAVQSTGNANDLMDQRDQLVTQLSQYIDINAYKQPDGSLLVSTGKGYPLVSGCNAYTLNFDGGRVNWGSVGESQVDITNSIAGGKIGGWLKMKNEVIPEIMANLDELSKSLIWEVNKIHSQGVGLEGFSSVTGTNAVTDVDKAMGSADSGLVYSNKIADGSFKLWLYDNNGSVVGSADIPVDADTTTMNDLAGEIDGLSIGGVDALNAVVKDGKLSIGTDFSHSGYSFAFSNDTSNLLPALGVNTFFQGSSSEDIAVNDNILTNTDNIAAAKINNNVGPAIGASGNTSTGIITTDGPYTGTADATYDIKITSPTDFQWRKDGGSWTTGVAMGSSVSLGSDGVSINFNGSFNAGDTFSIDATSSSDAYGEFASGDNSNVLNMADLQNQDVDISKWSYSGGGEAKSDDTTNTTLDEYLHTLDSSIGTQSQSVQREVQYKQNIQDQLTKSKDSVSGVSLDEEMTNLIKYQQAYTAAAKLITTAQNMLDALLNSVGTT